MIVGGSGFVCARVCDRYATCEGLAHADKFQTFSGLYNCSVGVIATGRSVSVSNIACQITAVTGPSEIAMGVYEYDAFASSPALLRATATETAALGLNSLPLTAPLVLSAARKYYLGVCGSAGIDLAAADILAFTSPAGLDFGGQGLSGTVTMPATLAGFTRGVNTTPWVEAY